MPAANENSADDMNRGTGARTIQEEAGAKVLTVHHSGKTTEGGARGYSSQWGAMDTELLVTKDKGRNYLKVNKQCDGEDQIKFRLELTPAQAPASGHQGTVESRVVTSRHRIAHSVESGRDRPKWCRYTGSPVRVL